MRWTTVHANHYQLIKAWRRLAEVDKLSGCCRVRIVKCYEYEPRGQNRRHLTRHARVDNMGAKQHANCDAQSGAGLLPTWGHKRQRLRLKAQDYAPPRNNLSRWRTPMQRPTDGSSPSAPPGLVAHAMKPDSDRTAWVPLRYGQIVNTAGRSCTESRQSGSNALPLTMA